MGKPKFPPPHEKLPPPPRKPLPPIKRLPHTLDPQLRKRAIKK